MANELWRLLAPRPRLSLRVNLTEAAAAVRASGLPLSTQTCRADTIGDWSALWLGPDEQLLIGPAVRAESAPEMAREMASTTLANALRGLTPALAHSLVDVSQRQCAVEVQGPHAADLINTGCPLDLGLQAFPVGSCTRTVFAKSEVVIWHRAAEHFELEVWRSFMPYLTTHLALVAPEFLQ